MLATDKVIKEFRVTEKATMLSAEQNKYTFEVFPTVNKKEVAHAIQKLFSVKVTDVNMLKRKGKVKRSRSRKGRPSSTSDVKLAVVTLKQGDKIEMV